MNALEGQDAQMRGKMVVRLARTAPTISLPTIHRTTASSLSPMAPSTFSWRFAEVGLCLRWPLRHLTPQHRLEGFRSQSGWLPNRIVFNNKSRFTLEADDSRLCV
ncbi:hypothetical protein TNCV_609031 [Trichonephila clavipes]|nr:hypothetical protein TNCV_609031 [Trichonephila clavipes]